MKNNSINNSINTKDRKEGNTMKNNSINQIAAAINATLQHAAEQAATEAAEEVIECQICGRGIRPGDEIITPDDETICPDCFSDNWFVCEECGDVEPIDDAVEVYDEYGDVALIVCQHCADHQYYRCDKCGRYFPEYAINYGVGMDLCPECLDDLRGGVLFDYHHGNPNGIVMNGGTGWSIVRGRFGVELEVSGEYPVEMLIDLQRATESAFGCESFDVWHAEEDCSVDGCEIIFQPRTIDDWRAHAAAADKLFSIMKAHGFKAEDGNGLHVHISRSAFGRDAAEIAQNVSKLAALFRGKSYALLCQIAGREEDDARRWARATDGGRTAEARKEYKASVTTRCRDRYEAVNVTNSQTIEIRLGRSTLDCAQFFGWLSLLAWLAARSHSISIEEAPSIDAWLWDAPDDVRTFVESRGVRLYNPEDAVVSNERVLSLLWSAVERLASIAELTSGGKPDAVTVLRSIGMTEAERRLLVDDAKRAADADARSRSTF